MLLNTPRGTGRSAAENHLAEMSMVLRLRNLACFSESLTLFPKKVWCKGWKSLFKMILSWELIGRGNKELRPPRAVSSSPAVASVIFLPMPHREAKSCWVRLSMCIQNLQTPSLNQDEQVKPSGG